MVDPVKVTIELGEYASRQIRLLARCTGSTNTAAAKAMVDLGCSTAESRIDAMCAALCPPGENVREWQHQVVEDSEE